MSWRFDCFGVKQDCFPPIQTCDKMYNFDQKCFGMTLSERKNSDFQSNEKIIITAYIFTQVVLPVLRT